MKYADKIRHAEKAANELLNEVSSEKVRADLKENGLYEADIDNVMTSARNIIGDKLKPLIRTKLLSGMPIKDAPEFEKLDEATLKKLAEQEINAIALGEKDKVKQLLKAGTPPMEIFQQVRLDFYPKEKVSHQIATFQAVEKENSGGSRLLKIFGGMAIMLVGIGISAASMSGGGGGRLFFGLIIVGFVMMVQGFLTVENPY